MQLPTARGGPLPPVPHPPPDLGRPSPHWPHGGRPGHERRYRVYRDLWGRGLHLTAGGKFGGDFLVYPGELGGSYGAGRDGYLGGGGAMGQRRVFGGRYGAGYFGGAVGQAEVGAGGRYGAG